MRLVDAVLSVPRVLLLLVIVASTGPLSVGGIILLLGSRAGRPRAACVRAEVRLLKERDYVLASRACGTRGMAGVRAITCCRARAAAARGGDARARDGDPARGRAVVPRLGVQPPTASWGSIISDAAERPGRHVVGRPLPRARDRLHRACREHHRRAAARDGWTRAGIGRALRRRRPCSSTCAISP